MQYDSLSYPLSIWKASSVMVIFFWSIYVWNMTKGRLIGHSLYMGHYVRYCCRLNTWKFQSVLDRHLKFKFPHWAGFPLSPTRPQQFHCSHYSGSSHPWLHSLSDSLLQCGSFHCKIYARTSHLLAPSLSPNSSRCHHNLTQMIVLVSHQVHGVYVLMHSCFSIQKEYFCMSSFHVCQSHLK